MAEGTVTFFAEKLSNLILQEASVFGQVECQIKLLRNELEWMRLFLKDADSKRIYDERIKLWVNQIRNATHDAEDVIDEFIVNMDHRQRRLNTLKLLKCLPTCVGFADKLPFIHELDSRVKDINVMIGAIMANRSKYGLGDLVASSSSTTDQVAAHKEKRPPVVEESDVVGIEDGTEEVKQMLMKEETRISVVSIVGMGGLGKTTLAKKVYNQRDVQQHFDCKAWVYVSQEFRAREILLDIANHFMSLSEKEKEMRESELGEKLCEYLKEKKYLVVMDDVWSSEVWSRLRSHLPEAKDGSKVLITTRNKEIALHATSQAFIYELRLMNDDESWQLFLKKTFQGTSTPHTLSRELEEPGKKIVAKCKGLPLAVVVLGGLLSTKEKTQPSWEKVLASIEWYLDQGPESCMGILALSYNDLPYYLKSCFLYCGIFPEDSEIEASKLIRLWLAEGFIQRRGKETLEDIAEDYMHELIHRSLIQVAERRVDGGVESCRMHDLLRDLAVLEAKDANFFEVHENIDFTFPISVRRLVIHQNLMKKNISQCLHNSQLRSLVSFSETIEQKSWRYLQEHIKLLTVLELGKTNMLPRDIGELIHLKFLCINGFGRVTLPSSICRLVNLQSLDLGYASGSIPYSIWKLQQLRHLNCRFCKVSSQFKTSKCVNGYLGVEQLTNLQTLALTGGSWLEGDGLGKLTQLRNLCLGGLLTPYLKKGFFESITKLTALQTLTLGIKKYSKKRLLNHLGLERQKNVIEEKTLFPGLEPFSSHAYLYELCLGGKFEKLPERFEFYPPNLLKLELWACELRDDPMMILEKLPSLRMLGLSLDAYVGRKMICSSEGFLQLESLELYRLNKLEELTVKEGAMSSLKTLDILSCDEMKKLPYGLLQLTNLEKLSLEGLSCRESIKEIEEAGGEDWNKLRKIMC
ncbi:putative disease resistance protein At1g50180 [Vitis riparia]|uniref:putative disease resistance protein At1g50180 n=1 Tax=Vitis riparia TaxID=96939 RepID=UPI00155A81DD|nr:putative disease resistance protein At1g50180 [Vitis riparia]